MASSWAATTLALDPITSLDRSDWLRSRSSKLLTCSTFLYQSLKALLPNRCGFLSSSTESTNEPITESPSHTLLTTYIHTKLKQ